MCADYGQYDPRGSGYEVMNEAQTIFTLFYAIYFATTVGLTRPYDPFDTAAVFKGDKIALVRLGFSLFLLNVIPLIYFVWIYTNWLETYSLTSVTFWGALGKFLLLLVFSLGGFGFYRMFCGVMFVKCNGKLVFYQECEPDKLKNVRFKEFWPHFLPGLLWILAILLVGVVWKFFDFLRGWL